MAQIRIGELLRKKGLITDNQINIAVLQQKITGNLLGETIVNLGFVPSRGIAEALAELANVEFLDINEYPISEDALNAVPKDVAEKAGFIPLSLDDNVLSIGIDNPGNILAIDVVTKLLKVPPKVYIVDGSILSDVLDRSYFFLANPIEKLIEDITRELTGGTVTGASVTRLIDLLIFDAIRRRATDLHLNPAAEVTNVMYRVDGVLQYGYCLPKIVHGSIVSRIKILAQLDIAEQRLPQDGSFNFKVLKKSYDMRVSTIPSLYGENTVVRILSASTSTSMLDIASLGFSPDDVRRINSLFKKPYGIILIVGPTGSGKTTTLYAALREVNLLEKNVLTVEDPVEYRLSFVKQTQVNEKAGYDFALAGRNFMRQDPDVILLGEIRDEETARIATRASLIGHLALSTLHSNDAITAIPRMLDLNVDRFMLSVSLLAVVAQRLVRKICLFCKTEYQARDDEAQLFREFRIEAKRLFYGKGCHKCGGIGYFGRTVISEIFIVDDEIKALIESSASIYTIKEAAIRNGMTPFRQDALSKAAKGITTLEEVLRVSG